MKNRILALVFVVRLALIHRQPVSSQHGFGDNAEPMFFCPIKKPCGKCTARFVSIIILFRQRLPPVRLLIGR